MRWQHPERGLVPPLDFIPLAEQTGLIVPIGRFVLREACRQMRAWHTSYPTDPPMTVSVNLSARELDEPGLVDSVRDGAGRDRSGPRPPGPGDHREPAAGRPAGHRRQAPVRAARAGRPAGRRRLRHRLLLAGLPREPAGRHPEDRQVLRRPHRRDAGGRGSTTGGAGSSRSWCRRSASSATRCTCDLVAEGIEQPEQVSALRGLACQFGQGYYFASPLTPDALGELLDRQADGAGLEPEPPSDPAPARHAADRAVRLQSGPRRPITEARPRLRRGTRRSTVTTSQTPTAAAPACAPGRPPSASPPSSASCTSWSGSPASSLTGVHDFAGMDHGTRC